MAETITQIDYPKDITFEKVWAAFMEDREQIRELKEQMKETDRQMKETDRIIGKLGNRFGELAEHLVSPGIMNKFNEMGFNFSEQSLDLKMRDANNPNIYTEVDILLENGDIVIAVEVKAKPSQEDIDDHVERMAALRKRADRRNDTRKYQGAIAGAIMSESVRNYIHKTGFYVIEQTGDTVRINIPENFVPMDW